MLENGQYKVVQNVSLAYLEKNGRTMFKRISIDPIILQDKSGNYVYDSKTYYENMSLIKGFFSKESIESIPNNYIGHIGLDEKGNYNREYDYCKVYNKTDKNQSNLTLNFFISFIIHFT